LKFKRKTGRTQLFAIKIKEENIKKEENCDKIIQVFIVKNTFLS